MSRKAKRACEDTQLLAEIERNIEVLKKQREETQARLDKARMEEKRETELRSLTINVRAEDEVVVFGGDRSVLAGVGGLDKYERFDVKFCVDGVAGTVYDPVGDIKFCDLESIKDIQLELDETSNAVAAFAKKIDKLVSDVMLNSDMFDAMLPSHPRLADIEWHNEPLTSNFTVTVTLDVFILKTEMVHNPIVRAAVCDVKRLTNAWLLSPERALLQFNPDGSDAPSRECGLCLFDVEKGEAVWSRVQVGRMEDTFRGDFKHVDVIDASHVIRWPLFKTSLFISDVSTREVATSLEIPDIPEGVSHVMVLPGGWVTTRQYDRKASPRCRLVSTQLMPGEHGAAPRSVTTAITESTSDYFTFVTREGEPRVIFCSAERFEWCAVDPLCGATAMEEVATAVKPIPVCNGLPKTVNLSASRHSRYILMYDGGTSFGASVGTINVVDGLDGKVVRKITTPPFSVISPPFGDTCLIGHKNTLMLLNIAPIA